MNGKDPLGHLTSTTLGNGLGVTQVFNGYTQRLTDGSVKAGANQLLLESYGYDALGNVSQRVQQWGGTSFTENFEYDSLNRLWHATIVGYGQQEFTYDDIGNIRRKSGVGTGNYVYPGSGSPQPHAVSSIPGVGSFGYDSNGNLTSGAGRTISWNSFDMPITMTKGGVSSTFYYGPDRQRVKQVRSDGVTIWYAGAMEVETSAAGSTIKTYLPESLGVEVDKSGATQLYYTHRDRLGSVVAMSNQAGRLVEKTAYDSWGKRRELASPTTPDSIDGVTDNKGFTGHEMLDQLDLVHMNGRVYDPLVARFLSADPIIQDPMHSQSYNRYSYVWNNPTNLTDPTGFQTSDSDGKTRSDTACNVQCKTERASEDRCKAMVSNCILVGCTNSERAGSGNKSKEKSGGEGGVNQSANTTPEKNYGDHWAEYKREVPFSGSDGPSTNATGYDNWALGKGYMTQDQWNDRAAARGAGAAIGLTAVGIGYAAEAAFVGQIGTAEARALYLSRVEQITANAAARLKNGDAAEAIAKDVVQSRNLLKLEVRELGPWAAARVTDLCNLVKYGNRAGPTAEQLFEKYGSWEKVIEAVQRTNQLVNKLVK